VNIISAAAIRRSAVYNGPQTLEPNSHHRRTAFKYPANRHLTKEHMWLVLRIAAPEKHELLVLNTFGYGAFKTPPDDVANCWSEVLDETEFPGG
jgi:hypothetical protein